MVRAALALITLAFLSAPAAAQWEGKWGAIAYGGAALAAGMAVDYPSAAEARQAALDSCGGRCARTVTFIKTCAAVAESRSATNGWAISRWRGRAIARALAACTRTGPDCTLVAVACTMH
jgi:hypothetical protein